MEKMMPCCAKFVTQERRARAEVARLARILSNAPHRKTSLMPQIQRAKSEVTMVENHRINHEAEHAGVPA